MESVCARANSADFVLSHVNCRPDSGHLQGRSGERRGGRVGRKEKEKRAKCGFYWRLGGDAEERTILYITQQKCPDTILGCICSWARGLCLYFPPHPTTMDYAISSFVVLGTAMARLPFCVCFWVTDAEKWRCTGPGRPRWCGSQCALRLSSARRGEGQTEAAVQAAPSVPSLSPALRPGSPQLRWSAGVFSPSLDTQLQSHAGSSHRPLWASVDFYISPFTGSLCQPDTPSCWNSLPPQLPFMKLFFPQLLVYSVCNILVCSDSCNANLSSQHHVVLHPDWPLKTHQGLASQTGSIKWGWRSPWKAKPCRILRSGQGLPWWSSG